MKKALCFMLYGFLLVLTIAGCGRDLKLDGGEIGAGGSGHGNNQTSGITVRAIFPESTNQQGKLSAPAKSSDVVNVVILATWSGHSKESNCTMGVESSWICSMQGLAAGVQVEISITASDANNDPLFRGMVEQVLIPGEALIFVNMQPMEDFDNMGGHIPLVRGVVYGAAEVLAGNEISLEIQVVDGDEDAINIEMESSLNATLNPESISMSLLRTFTVSYFINQESVTSAINDTIKISLDDGTGLSSVFIFELPVVPVAALMVDRINFPPDIEGISTVVNGDLIELSAVASDDHDDPGELSYRWYVDNIAVGTGVSITGIALPTGSAEIKVVVTDTDGGSSEFITIWTS